MEANKMMTFLIVTGLLLIRFISLTYASQTTDIHVLAGFTISKSPTTSQLGGFGHGKWYDWNEDGVKITFSTHSISQRPTTIHATPTPSFGNFGSVKLSTSLRQSSWQFIRPSQRPSTTQKYIGYHPNRRYRIRSRDRYLLQWHVLHTTKSPGLQKGAAPRTAALRGNTGDDLGAAAIVGLTVICLTVITMVCVGSFLIYRRVHAMDVHRGTLKEDEMTEAMVVIPPVSAPSIEPKADDTPPSHKSFTGSYEVPCEVNTTDIEHNETHRGATEGYSSLVTRDTGDQRTNETGENDDGLYEEIAEYIKSK